MNTASPELKSALENDFALQLHDAATLDDVRYLLARAVNDMIVHDFERLLGLLYRVDIDERKLKQVTAENPGKDAGLLIAQLIIERQQEKMEARKKHTRPKQTDDNEERW
jgi:hypothetical protein